MILQILVPVLIILVGLSLLKCPIYISIMCAAIYLQVFVNDMSLASLFTGFFEAMTKNALLAVPFFMVAGSIIAASSLGTRLINVFIELLKKVRGGLPIACVGDMVTGPVCTGSMAISTAVTRLMGGRPIANVTTQVVGVNPITGIPVTTAIAVSPNVTRLI